MVLKRNFVMNVNWDCNKNICEAIITITFPGKQTIMILTISIQYESDKWWENKEKYEFGDN